MSKKAPTGEVGRVSSTELKAVTVGGGGYFLLLDRPRELIDLIRSATGRLGTT